MGARIGGGGAGGGSQVEALYSRQVPVAHCFGPRGLYKRKFCAVCRKGLEAPALRCEGTTHPESQSLLHRVAQACAARLLVTCGGRECFGF